MFRDRDKYLLRLINTFSSVMAVNVINVKKANLKKLGYPDFASWQSADDAHLYIGRNMNFYVPGAFGSKWQNPYPVKDYGLDRCLELYEAYIRSSGLYDELEELQGKILGCWCKLDKCHGDILRKLLAEKLVGL